MRSQKIKIHYRNRFLAYLIGCVIITLFIIGPDVFIKEDSLIEIRGTLDSSKYETIFRTNNAGRLGTEIDANLAQVTFTLHGRDEIFQLSKNVGSDYSYSRYSQLNIDLLNSKIIQVFIKKSELNSIQPEIFEIRSDDKFILISKDEIIADTRFLFYFILLISSLGFIFILIREYYKN